MADTYSIYGGRSKRDFYAGMVARLKTERSSFNTHWQELADHIAPRRARFYTTDTNKGDKRRSRIIDSTPSFSHRVLQSGLHSGLTSPARPWFRLTTADPALSEQKNVREWLYEVTRRMQLIFEETNLYNALPVVYGDLGTFGTAAMSMIADDKDVFRCYTYPLGLYVIATDSRGKVCTFAREDQLTVRQLVEQFGGPDGTRAKPGAMIDWTRISTVVKKLWDEGKHEEMVEVCWVVHPNPDRDDDLVGAKYFPFASCYFEVGDNRPNGKLLKESGFKTFPIMAPRWDVVGEDAYGTECPGMIALGDIKQLQSMQKKKGQALSKIIDPPLTGPLNLRTQKTSLLAGDVTYVDETPGTKGLRPIHEIGLNLQHFTMDMQDVQGRIRKAYYEDLFLMLAAGDPYRGAQPITAREVEERHEEKLLALGPVLERTNDELLDPCIDRAWELMNQAGLLPDPPDELQGMMVRVEYVSIMAAAQKLVGVVGQDRFLQTIVPLAEQFPEVKAKLNTKRLVDNYADMLSIDPAIVVDDETADATLAAQAKAASIQQGSEVAANLGKAAPLAQIPVGQGNTVLDRVLSGAGA